MFWKKCLGTFLGTTWALFIVYYIDNYVGEEEGGFS